MSPRTPLLRPDRYFAEREASVWRALGVVLGLTALLVAAVFGIGWVFTSNIDGTVMVDNPERPPDVFCDDHFGDDFGPEEGCDQPREIERDIDVIIERAIERLAGRVLLVYPLVWLVLGLLLHAGSWLAGGENGAHRSFAVAAWGLAPTAVGVVVGIAVLAATFDPVTVAPADDPSVLRDRVLAQFGPLRTVGTAMTVVTSVWAGVVWRYGLEHQRDLTGAGATAVAGTVALLTLLLGLA